MNLPGNRISYLWEVYTSKRATPEEEQELMEWLVNSDDEPEFKDYVQKLWHEAEPGSNEGTNWDELYDRISESKKGKLVPLKPSTPHKRISPRRIVAAAIIIAAITGGYLLFTGKKPDASSPILAQEEDLKDIPAPVENRAFIRSSDGRTIALNNSQRGLLATQGDTRLVKQPDGQIVYQKTAEKTNDSIVYNTLYNPKGSTVIDLLLTDGSHVWLNAASSITYPVKFVGNERKVTMKGEVYFEVSHNADRPFKVVSNGVEITVLGTHFDINAFDDDPTLKVSLLQGSVRVTKGLQKTLLHPGQQAKVESGIRVQNDIDAKQVTAWKDGLFSFENTSLVEVMQQIARWYNVDVKYEGQVPQRQFGGKIRRNSTLGQVLKILEESGVHYRVNNKEIVILP